MTGEYEVLLQGAPRALHEIQVMLRESGVTAEIVRPPDGGGGGWSTRGWLAVARQDLGRARQLIEAFQDAQLTEEERRAAQVVVDLDGDETTCPACMTAFDPKQGTRCPECGLNFG